MKILRKCPTLSAKNICLMKIYTKYHNNTNKQQKRRSKFSRSILFDFIGHSCSLKER